MVHDEDFPLITELPELVNPGCAEVDQLQQAYDPEGGAGLHGGFAAMIVRGQNAGRQETNGMHIPRCSDLCAPQLGIDHRDE